MKQKTFIFILFFFLICLHKTAFSSERDTSKVTISDGKRIVLLKKGFSIVPPLGWQIIYNYPNTTLLMQIKKPRSIKVYQRTIQVMSFSNPVYIDNNTAKQFADLIAHNFSLASGNITDYKITSRGFAKTINSTPGILFYASFNLSSKPMMHAHFLVSSAKNHYIITFTDIAQHFLNNDRQKYFDPAWQSMSSIELDSKGPVSLLKKPLLISGIIIGVILFFILIIFIRSRRRKNYDDVDLDDSAPLTDDDIDTSPLVIVEDKLPDSKEDISIAGDDNTLNDKSEDIPLPTEDNNEDKKENDSSDGWKV